MDFPAGLYLLLAAIVFALVGGFCFWREDMLEKQASYATASAVVLLEKAALTKFVGWYLLVIAFACFVLFLVLPT